jgi:hypothetical protein
VFTKIADRFASVGGLRHHLHVWLTVDDCDNPSRRRGWSSTLKTRIWFVMISPHCLTHQTSVHLARQQVNAPGVILR